jgi:hypothetical protein
MNDKEKILNKKTQDLMLEFCPFGFGDMQAIVSTIEAVGKSINDAYINNCDSLETLSELEIVGDRFNLYYIPSLKDLGKLKIVGGNLIMYNLAITTLGSLEKVGKRLDIENCTSLTSIGNLNYYADFNLKTVSNQFRKEIKALQKTTSELEDGGFVDFDEVEPTLHDDFNRFSRHQVMQSYRTDFKDGYPYFTPMADTNGDVVVVDGFGILNDGTMVVFDGVNWNVKHHFGKEHDDRYEISDYWETESFADGGLVKTKSIITDKIGWTEEVADYLIEQDSKLAIWFADSYMKYWINKYDAKPNLDWVGLSLPQKIGRFE